MRTLILVDIQNDFLPGGALGVPEGDRVVPIANALMTTFDLVVATQDWHPPEHGSFATNHEGKRPGEVIELSGLSQVLWPTHCVEGTRGADFAPGLRTDLIRKIFPKGTNPAIDSYSGFFDNGRKQATGLGAYLQKQGAGPVYVMGLATDYCVKATALDAVALGFETYLVTDGCRGVNLAPGDTERAEQAMRDAGIRLVSSDEVGV